MVVAEMRCRVRILTRQVFVVERAFRCLPGCRLPPGGLLTVRNGSAPVVRKRRRIMVAALAISIPAAAVVYAALPSEAATAPAAGGIYQLAVTKSGMCIDVTAG